MIRWIVDKKLGTASFNTLGETTAIILDVRDLVDKRGNSVEALREKIRTGVVALSRGEAVVVACDFGISRSNAVAAGVLSSWLQIDINEAIAKVLSKTGENSIKLEMIDSVRSALGITMIDRPRNAILVTGASGFLGRALCRSIYDEFTVLAPTRASLDLLGSTVALERFCAENDVGQIVHLAFPRVYTNNSALGESLVMLRNILDVCKSRGIRLILASGAVVFSGYRTEMMLANPWTPCFPRGVYGETKFLEETLVNTAVANGDLQACIARLSPIYGPGGLRPRIIQFSYEAIIKDLPVVIHKYKNGTPKLQLLYLEDAASGLAEIVRSGVNGTYHFGGDEFVAPRDIIIELGALVNKAPRIEFTEIDDFIGNVMLDWSATRSELGWSAKVKLSDGLHRMFAVAKVENSA